MNEKDSRCFIILLVVACSFILASGLICYFIGRTDTADSAGIGEYQHRERDLLERIGEYQQREEERNRREAERIAAERSRIERTEAAIRAIREADRRSGGLLQELAAEVDILEGYFRGSRGILNNGLDNPGSE